MANYPNVPFVHGDPYPAELAYESFYCPVFDGQTQYLGHRPPLNDFELSPTGIRLDVSNLKDKVKVSVVSGLTVGWTSGQVLSPLGELQTISPGQIAVPDNATSYIYVDRLGAVQVGTRRAVMRVTLAKCVSVSGAITLLDDYRHPSILRVQPPSYVLRSFGGQSTTPKVCTQGEVLRGVVECSTFTVPAGVTVTVDKFYMVVCSGDVEIYGTVNVTPQVPGAPKTQYGLLTVGGYVGFSPGQGLGNTGAPYSYTQQKYGSSGGLGYIYNRPGNASNSWGYLNKGGDGGGTLWIEAAGNITVYTSATLAAPGGNGSTPGSTDGGTTFACLASGSGGGAAGCIGLISAGAVTVQAGATVDLRGGNGGNGYIHAPGYGSPLYAAPGAPGSGGYFVTIGQNGVNTTGVNFLSAGGNWGTWASLNSGVTVVNATTITVATTTFGIGTPGIGAGYAGSGGGLQTTSNGTLDTAVMTPAASAIQVTSTNLPSG